MKYNIKLIKTIKAHNNWINSIKLFPSGNIISVSNDKSIKIYDFNLKLLQSIKNAHDDYITSLDIKDENNFVTCSWDHNIKTWIKTKNNFKLNQILKNTHSDWINQVQYFLNDNLISCSNDCTIKIWEENNKKYQIQTILNVSDWVGSILILEDKNILITSGYDGTKFWNINNFELIINFSNINCGYKNALKRIDENKIILGGKFLTIFSIDEKKNILKIKLPFTCIGMEIIKNKNLILIGGGSEDILIYEMENYEYIQIIKKAHDDNIDGFIQKNNNRIISYSNDGKIKLWKFDLF